jgi:hypothetical protein
MYLNRGIFLHGMLYVWLTVQNTGMNPLALTSPDSVQVNLDGLIVGDYGDQSLWSWYALNGVVKSPVPVTVSGVEAQLFVRNPSHKAPPTLGFFLDKLTSWSSIGVTNYGIRAFDNATRGKDAWIGTLASLAPGQVLPFSLLLEVRRDLTQSQSLDFDADYRAPAITVDDGVLATGDNEPLPQTFSDGFNLALGAYVIGAPANHVNATLNFPAGVTTRWAPRYKITGWTKGAPTLTWNGQALVAGVDYNYVVDSASGTLYVQLNFDVVAGSPGPGQRTNAALDIG